MTIYAHRIFKCVSIVLSSSLLIALSACSSSSTGPADTEAPFENPVDAETLRAALTTGTSASDATRFWECSLSDSNNLFQYRLFADGTGTETDVTNQNTQSGLSWSTSSASSMSTVAANTGAQTDFTNIQFSGRSNVSLTATQNMVVVCQLRGLPSTPSPQAGNNALSYGGVQYALTHGFEESFSFRPSQQNDTHSTSEFQVADAEFQLLTLVTTFVTQSIWRPNGSTVRLRAKLSSPGGGRFSSATFEYESDSTDSNGPLVAGRNFFQEAVFGIDTDRSGTTDAENNEFLDVVGGTISVTRLEGNNARMSFDLVLEDGTSLAGNFEGLFVLFDNN